MEKLQLRRETTGVAARGFNHQISILPQYENVNRAQPTNANFSHLWSPPRNTQTIPTAMLINDDLKSNVSIRQPSLWKAPLKNTARYIGILGYPAMAKLNIGMYFGGNYIFSVERVCEYISTVWALMNDYVLAIWVTLMRFSHRKNNFLFLSLSISSIHFFYRMNQVVLCQRTNVYLCCLICIRLVVCNRPNFRQSILSFSSSILIGSSVNRSIRSSRRHRRTEGVR